MKNLNEKLAILGGRPILKKSLPGYNSLGREEGKAILAVMKKKILSDFVGRAGNKFLGGEFVRKFETEICRFFGVRHAVSFNSASTALQAAVGALGIGPGDEVITSPYTMSASASAILLNNAIPVFADVDPDTYCLDAASVEKRITRKTKAMMLINLFGGSSDFGKIIPLARKYNLRIIEDNAQSIGARYKNKYLGTIGDIGVFSFNVHKSLQCGEGGVLVTNNERLAFRAQLIRNHGEVVIDDLYDESKIYEPIIGSNYRLSELHAAIASEQLKKIYKLNQPRQKLAEYLTSRLKQFKWLQPAKVLKNSRHVYYVYPFKFFENKIGISRLTFAKAMEVEGFPLGQGYVKPLYLMPLYQKKEIFPRSKFPFISKEFLADMNYKKGICPVTERLWAKELLLSTICHPPLVKKDMDLFIEAIKKIERNIIELTSYEKKNKK
jgi:dTDP-4-amino-4,6-dideoxygalactose transaminase